MTIIIKRNKKGQIKKCLQFGKLNNQWKGDKCTCPRVCLYQSLLKNKNVRKECYLCKTRNRLITHHKDGNFKNNNLDNLEYICKGCHNKVHIRNPIGKNNCVRDLKGRFSNNIELKINTGA